MTNMYQNWRISIYLWVFDLNRCNISHSCDACTHGKWPQLHSWHQETDTVCTFWKNVKFIYRQVQYLTSLVLCNLVTVTKQTGTAWFCSCILFISGFWISDFIFKYLCNIHVLFYYFSPHFFLIPIKDISVFPALTDPTSAQRAAYQTVSFRAEQL